MPSCITNARSRPRCTWDPTVCGGGACRHPEPIGFEKKPCPFHLAFSIPWAKEGLSTLYKLLLRAFTTACGQTHESPLFEAWLSETGDCLETQKASVLGSMHLPLMLLQMHNGPSASSSEGPRISKFICQRFEWEQRSSRCHGRSSSGAAAQNTPESIPEPAREGEGDLALFSPGICSFVRLA